MIFQIKPLFFLNNYVNYYILFINVLYITKSKKIVIVLFFIVFLVEENTTNYFLLRSTMP